MADDPHNTSDIETGAAKEDAETTAARRELKQTSISEKAGHAQQLSQDDKSASDDDAPQDKAPPRRVTPDITLGPPREEVLREQISSPKKKRAHDELDENKDVAETLLEEGAPPKPAATGATQSRTDRFEPEKKRPRDRQASASAVKSGQEEVEPLSGSTSRRSSMESTGASKTEKPQTSAAAFASSGFAKFGRAPVSPFGALGASGKPSPFASASSSSSGSIFGAPKPSVPSSPPKLSFASKTAASPFASLNGQGAGTAFKSSPFASAFGGSALPGSRLTNFGKPGEVPKSDKPAKPFGAPDSDAEAGSEDEESRDDASNAEAGPEDPGDKEIEKDRDESKTAADDDKKKPKLQKVVIDDGEGQELTLFSARAKMYIMEKGVGWKERGAGMLKINVPKSTVDLDDQGVPDPTTFDASALDDNNGDEEAEEGHAGRKHVRLIMRQDHTLRVILNTVILPAMKFQLTNRLKAATVLFTAFEGGEARQVQMKLSEANAKTFSQVVELLKKRLADV
ncbi:PH domain-like protein [Canariomyces notabilis]|uniref:PH domain-like protein n=1 Tax=Canariomyces notabilis TaxID=2074819 RepID=A0AAN6YRH1_9PEZI|nr:PH domain-like protein [Canariomyces arenarius]